MLLYKSTIAIFIKLFAIKIVAKSFFGLSRRLIINFSLLVSFVSSLEKSEGFSEKRATSDPEINPDATSKITIVLKLTISGMVICKTIMKLKGSMSNLKVYIGLEWQVVFCMFCIGCSCFVHVLNLL